MNSFMGLFDSPPHRDWLVWWTAGWTVVAGISIGFPSEGSTSTSSLPRWLDALLAAIVFGILLGIFPAYLRLLVRRLRSRKARRAGASTPDITRPRVVTVPPPAPRSSPPPLHASETLPPSQDPKSQPPVDHPVTHR